jgi:hypothetical protein
MLTAEPPDVRDSLQVVPEALTTKYLVLVDRPAGSVPVVVRVTAAPFVGETDDKVIISVLALAVKVFVVLLPVALLLSVIVFAPESTELTFVFAGIPVPATYMPTPINVWLDIYDIVGLPLVTFAVFAAGVIDVISIDNA